MKKLIILFNLTGSYKGGAQKRYLSLFEYLQKNNSDYFLLLNKSLYNNCRKDNIIHNNKNVIRLSIKYEIAESIKCDNKLNNVAKISNNRKSKLRYLLGPFKYFLKCTISSIDYCIKLYFILNKYKFNSVYCIWDGGKWSLLLFKLFKIQYIYSYNDASFFMLSQKKMNFWKSEYFCLKNAQFIDCLSPAIAQGLMLRFPEFKKEKLLISPNSFIDYTKFVASTKKENWISFCSRLEVLKNPLLLVESVILIKDKLNGYIIKIIGTGGEYNRIKNMIEENSLQNYVHLCGALDSSLEIVSKSKIFVSIQQDNNYPSQSLLEAMACKNAIIASDVGETRLLVTDKEGILVELTPKSISEAILKLINDEYLIEKKSKAAYIKATTEHTVEKFANYFISITDDNKKNKTHN